MSDSATPLKDRLRTQSAYLIRELRVSNYINELYAAEVISALDKEELKARQGKRKQASFFVDIMMGKSENAIAKFWEIVKTRKDEQPHIYDTLFPENTSTEQQDGFLRLPRGSNAATRLDPETRLLDCGWEEIMGPRLQQVESELRPCLFLDQLRFEGQITEGEYKHLQSNFTTEKERSQWLLHNVPKKGQGSFTNFCQLLLKTNGQQHIVTEILEVTDMSPAENPAGPLAHCDQQVTDSIAGTDARSLAGQKPTFTTPRLKSLEGNSFHVPLLCRNRERHQEDHTSADGQETFVRLPTARKRKLDAKVCAKDKRNRREGAYFFCKAEHEELIKPIAELLKSMCVEGLRLTEDMVTFAYAKMQHVRAMLQFWHYPCYLDLDSKLAVLIVDGLESSQVVRCRDTLENFIRMHLRNVARINPSFELVSDECRILEIISGSALVVILLGIDFYLSLFCSLGNRETRRKLSTSLQQILPGSTRATLRLGGLPPFPLFDNLLSDPLRAELEVSSMIKVQVHQSENEVAEFRTSHVDSKKLFCKTEDVSVLPGGTTVPLFSSHEKPQPVMSLGKIQVSADKAVKHMPSSVAAISTGKLYEDLVARLELIEENPFELVWKTSQEQVRKIYDTLIKFVDAILDEEQWREADVPGLLDALVDTKNLTIPETALVPVKQHWEKRLAILKEREQADKCLQQSSNNEALVTGTNVYHCALLSQAVYLNSQDDVVSFINKQPNHQLDGVALSDGTSSPQYLIATSQDVVYAAFKGSDHLSVWAMEHSSKRSAGKKRGRRTGRAFRYRESVQYGFTERDIFRAVSYLPLRYFARQLISRKKVIFTGHSLGGTTAVLVTGKLLMEHFQATEENVACVTFGQLSNIAVNRPSVQKMAEMPECFHSFICEEDTIPKSVDFWSLARKRLRVTSRLFHRPARESGRLPRLPYSIDSSLFPLYSSILETIDDLAEGKERRQTDLQNTEYLRLELQSKVSPFLTQLKSAVYASSHTLTQYRMGVYHVLDLSSHTHKLYEVWSDRTEISELSFNHTSFETALFPDKASVMQHSMDYYLKSVADIIMDTSRIRSSSTDAKKVKNLESVVPHVSSTGFQMRGTDQVVVTVEGDNMWFVTQVDIAGISKPLLVEPSDADQRSVSVVLNADEVVYESSATRAVTVQSHFSEYAKFQTKVVAKRFGVTLRQKQLAKYSPRNILEMAFLQVLLERRIGRSTGLRTGEYSKRFKFVTEFVERAVEIVPVESILYGIETAEDDMLFHCVEAACQLLAKKDPKVQMSEMLMTGIKKAIQRLTSYYLQMGYGCGPGEDFYTDSVLYDDNCGVETANYEDYPFVYEDTTRGPQLNADIQEEGGQLDLDITRLLHYCHDIIQRLKECEGVRFPSMIKDDSNLLVSEKFLNVAWDRICGFQDSLEESRPPMVMALCGLDVREVYPAVKAEPTIKERYFESPVDMLDRHRKELNDLAREQAVLLKLEQEKCQTVEPPDLSVESYKARKSTKAVLTDSGDETETKTRNAEFEVDATSMYTNQKMLQLVTSMRSEFKATSLLLGAFMEARIRIPFTRSKLENVEAMFAAAKNKLGVGVWALFRLPEQELRQLLSLPGMDALVVNVAQFLGEWCDGLSESKQYAGKLQFIVNSIRNGVNASSQNVHYWLERQLVEQCRELRISENISLKQLLSNWEYYFKDDLLSVVAKTYRPLVARWFKWSLMVHNLRETLASYVAVGVIGLVNSGKSRLVERLFGITVAAGTVEKQRTTVPFVYSLEEDIPGLDIIDFPGVDDQDPTIPDLAKFLLGLAQFVVFVVDYRKCHTESTQEWIEELKGRDIPFIMCFSYGDKLYAEKMHPATDSGRKRHPDKDYVRQIVATQIDDTFTKVDDKVKCLDKSDVMMISIAQDNDSVLNSSEGRKRLESAGILGPKEVGYRIADKLRILLHKEVAKNLETFVGKKFQERRHPGTSPSSDK